jgi:aconitase B
MLVTVGIGMLEVEVKEKENVLQGNVLQVEFIDY